MHPPKLTSTLHTLRGAGYTFGSQVRPLVLWSAAGPSYLRYQLTFSLIRFFHLKVVKKFLSLNSFEHMLRAHQLCMDGYSELFDRKLSTVWSAPNVSRALLIRVFVYSYAEPISLSDKQFRTLLP